VEALTGLRRPASGTVRLDGRDVTGFGPDRLFDLGLAHVPEDRQREGLVGSFSVADNLVLNQLGNPPFSRRGRLDRDAITRHAGGLVADFDVRTSSVDEPAATLSGGNQQKVIVAREFFHSRRLLVLSQPTRGLDVGSIQYIHARVVEKRDEGAAVLLVSSELDEVMALADRIAVMYRGRIIGVLHRANATRDNVGCLMAGVEIEPDEIAATAGEEVIVT
ncbi:MAG: ATP-binding cassette domain-containing protein, partial [Acidimicrobiales bacterium]